jgi:hypothetical protein
MFLGRIVCTQTQSCTTHEAAGVLRAVESACATMSAAAQGSASDIDEAARVIIAVATEVAGNPQAPRVQQAVDRALTSGVAPISDTRHGMHGRNLPRPLRYTVGGLAKKVKRCSRRQQKAAAIGELLREAAEADDGGEKQRRVDQQFRRDMSGGTEISSGLPDIASQFVEQVRGFSEYTDDDVEAIARDQGCEPQSLHKAIGHGARNLYVSVADYRQVYSRIFYKLAQ